MLNTSNRVVTHIAVRDWKWRPAKLVRSLPGPIRSLTLAGALSATKKNGDCEVFIRLLDKHYSLMQFCGRAFLSRRENIYLLESSKTVCHSEGFLSIEHNGSGIGHVTVGPWDWTPQYIHSKTIYLHAGIKCTLRSIFTMAFHIHPKWLFYRFAPPTFIWNWIQGHFRETIYQYGETVAWAQLWNALTSEKKSKRLSRSNDV